MSEQATSTSVRVQGLGKRFGDNVVLRDIDLVVPRGEVLVVMGPSGSGKTTFIRSLNFLEMPDAGTVEVCGTTVRAGGRLPDAPTRRAIREIRQKTAMVFQSFNLFPHMTALDNVIEGLVSVRGSRKPEAREAGLALLARVGLEAKAGAYPQQLSGGQKQRVAIARALAMKPEVIFFDEPTSALDPELRDDVLQVMRSLADDGMTMLVVTHEIRFAQDVADRVVFFEGGRIQEDRSPKVFFGAGASARAKQFLGRLRHD